VSGAKVKYTSVPWFAIKVFGVRSAGSFLDKDSEMMIWTDISDITPASGSGEDYQPPEPGISYLEVDFQKDKVDLMVIHRYLSAKILNVNSNDCMSNDLPVQPVIFDAGPTGGLDSFLSWLGDDTRAIDPEEMDERLHSGAVMLQEDEHVVMAFKCGRDTTCFTTKRVLRIDVQGFTGKKIEYKSIPYASLRAFSVESAGAWDRDSEVKLHPKVYWLNGEPGSTFELDLRKGKADIISLQHLLAIQVIGMDEGSPMLLRDGDFTTQNEEGVNAFLSWLGDDSREIDAAQVDSTLHSSPPILLKDERVDMAFKCGRDMLVFTTKRILVVDVQGWTGNKVEYKSIPLKYCGSFAVQSAGTFDRDSEMFIWTDAPGTRCIEKDLRDGTVNLFSIQEMLVTKLLESKVDFLAS